MTGNFHDRLGALCCSSGHLPGCTVARRLGTQQGRGLTSHWIAARGISLLWQLREWEQTLIYPWRLQNIILCHALLQRTSSQPTLPTVMQYMGQDLTAPWVTLLQPFKAHWLLYVPPGLTSKNTVECYVFCTYLRIRTDRIPLPFLKDLLKRKYVQHVRGQITKLSPSLIWMNIYTTEKVE